MSDEPPVSEAGSGTDGGDAVGRVHDLPAPVTAAARRALPLVVALIGQLGAVSVDFGLPRGRRPPWAVPNSVSRRRTATRRRTVLVDQRTHRRAFPAGAATSALFDDLSIDPPERYTSKGWRRTA
ncbi:hypothetical protein ACWDE9_10190 [Streptomyces olivaceoviridis]